MRSLWMWIAALRQHIANLLQARNIELEKTSYMHRTNSTQSKRRDPHSK